MSTSYRKNLQGDEKLTQRRKRRESSSPMPAASAGLLRFFEEETQGIKVRPEFVIVLTVALILAAVLARVFLPL
jgi:preprotein translocase subunit Sec61beta